MNTPTHNHACILSLGAFIAMFCLLAATPALAGDWPDYNFLGGDYHHFESSSDRPMQAANECRQACMDDARCRAATLVDAGVQAAGYVCWLKDSDFEIVEDRNTNSWLKPEYYAAVADTNRAGMDFRSMEFSDPAMGAAECRRQCQADSRCRAFTFVEPGLQAAGGMCWLKDGVPEATPAAGCHSGLIYERVDTGPHFTVAEVVGLSDLVLVMPEMDGVNLPGSDYFNFFVSTDDPGMCRQACERDDHCRAYTYVRPGVQGVHGRCWLKDDVPDQVDDPNTVSGVIR